MVRSWLVKTLVLVVALAAGGLWLLPECRAMGKRHPAARAQQQETNAPEIEIITMSDQGRGEFSAEQQPRPQSTVAPEEILPPVSASEAATEQKSRLKDIQTALKNAGYDPGPIDGKTGPKTKKAIRAFQRAHNLTVDGIVGEKTWAQLKKHLASPPAAKQ